MSKTAYEQENDILEQLSVPQHNGKMQANVIQKPLTTPSAKTFSSLKKTGDKSSRKAFGNVSNVLRSTAPTSLTTSGVKKKLTLQTNEEMGAKIEKKSQDIKETKVEKKDLTKAETKEQTDTKVDPKFLDEIENMYPNEAEVMLDPTTFDLFTIDEEIAEMGFDEDLCETLVPKKTFDFDELF